MHSTPQENFESSAPAKARANLRDVRRSGLRHNSPRVHSANTLKRAMATSVSTNGPKARNVGIVV